MTEYDLVVVGGGPGGYVAALRAAQLGLRVGCVDEHELLGGTCLRVGCIPSKALLESSGRLVEARDELAVHGVVCGSIEVDLAAMMRRKEKVVSILCRGVASLFRKHGVTHHCGRGRLLGGGKVLVEGEGGAAELQAPRVLLASGSQAASLPGVELDGRRVGTSTEALSYGSVPRHLVVIGAGYIGLELGSVWSRLGAEVTVLEVLDRILPVTDAEIAAEARKLLAKQGLKFRLGCRVAGARAEGDGCRVELDGGEVIECDRVLVAVGRRPNTDGLGLEEAGVELTERGWVAVDESFATTAPGIHAVGDLVGGALLAHKAEHEGIACVERMVTGAGHVDAGVIPSVCYTHPEIAAVGRTEEQLAADGVDCRKGVFPFRGNGRARTLGQVDGFVKVLADAETDELMGVHILGPRAGDLIAEAALAMTFGGTAEDLGRMCHVHPTLSEAIKEGALAVDGRALHV